MGNLIRIKRKGDVLTIVNMPRKGVLDLNLVEILSENSDKSVDILFLEDTHVLGGKSKGNSFYNIAHMLKAVYGRKPSIAVTPWRELSNILKKQGIKPTQMFTKATPIHYKDEYCIPCDTDKQNGLFYIIKKDIVKQYIDTAQTREGTVSDRNSYYKGYEKRLTSEDLKIKEKISPLDISQIIGDNIAKRISMLDNIDTLFLNVLLPKDINRSIKFEIKDKLIDPYRFLSVFDGDKYSNDITKEDIIKSTKIIIESYKENSMVQRVELLTKNLVK